MTRRAAPASPVPLQRRAAGGRRRSVPRAALAVAAAALAGALAWAVFFSSVLAVDTVRVEGVGEEDSRPVLEAAGVSLGTPLARLDVGDVAARVRQQVPFVREASVTRAWPHTVVVHAVPRTALLAARGPSGQVRLVDEHGVAFRSVPTVPPGLPTAGVSGFPEEGDTDGGLQAAAEVLRVLPEQQRSQVSDLTASSANLVTFRLGRVKVVWGGPGEGAKKAAVLGALLATRPATVDVSAPDLPVTT